MSMQSNAQYRCRYSAVDIAVNPLVNYFYVSLQDIGHVAIIADQERAQGNANDNIVRYQPHAIVKTGREMTGRRSDSVVFSATGKY